MAANNPYESYIQALGQDTVNRVMKYIPKTKHFSFLDQLMAAGREAPVSRGSPIGGIATGRIGEGASPVGSVGRRISSYQIPMLGLLPWLSSMMQYQRDPQQAILGSVIPGAQLAPQGSQDRQIQLGQLI